MKKDDTMMMRGGGGKGVRKIRKTNSKSSRITVIQHPYLVAGAP